MEDSGLKTGIGCGLVLALVIGLMLFALNGVTTYVDRLAMERAEYVRAQAEYEIAAAASRQMDAATYAVTRDTETAHGFMVMGAPWVLVAGVGLALLAVCGVLFAVLYTQLQITQKQLSELAGKTEVTL